MAISSPIFICPFHTPHGGLYLDPAQQDLVSGAITLVELNNILPEFADGIEDTVNHRIIPGVAGFYLIDAMITYQNIVADKKYQLIMQISGVTRHSMFIYSSGADSVELSLTFARVLYLSNVDFVELYARQNAGVNTVDIDAPAQYTYLTVQRVG